MRAALSVVLVFFAVSVAAAHPQLDRARELHESADFRGALATLDALAESDELDRDELIELLELRARLHIALGARGHAAVDLGYLLALTPELVLPENEHPLLLEAFEIAKRGVVELALEVDRAVESERVRLRARVSAPTGLVRHVEIRARADEGAWEGSVTEELDVAIESGTRELDYVAIAVGLGGSHIASERGRIQLPTRSTNGDDEMLVAPPELASTRWRPWVVAVSLIVLAGVATGVGIALRRNADTRIRVR